MTGMPPEPLIARVAGGGLLIHVDGLTVGRGEDETSQSFLHRPAVFLDEGDGEGVE